VTKLIIPVFDAMDIAAGNSDTVIPPQNHALQKPDLQRATASARIA
jgi:hypothetical protein